MSECDEAESCRYAFGCEGYLDCTANPGPAYGLVLLERVADDLEVQGVPDVGLLRDAIDQAWAVLEGDDEARPHTEAGL